jgi:hypothetical protein
LTEKGYFAVFISSSSHLRLFSVKKRTETSSLTYFCHLCDRKLCSHIKEEVTQEQDNNFFNEYDFEYENDFECGPVEELNDLVSKETYPCKPLH